MNLLTNKFEYTYHNGKKYIGSIDGVQILRNNTKFHFVLHVNEDNYSIWYNDWISLEDVKLKNPNITDYNIDIDLLLTYIEKKGFRYDDN